MSAKMERFAKYFPPGFEYRKEIGLAGGLFGLAAAFSLRFFGKLYVVISRAEHLGQTGETPVPRVSFAELAAGYWALFIPVLAVLLLMPLYHYIYYYRETKSIYVMRRLSRRGVTFKSCVQGPVLEAALVLLSAALIYLIYYGIYRLCIWTGLLS